MRFGPQLTAAGASVKVMPGGGVGGVAFTTGTTLCMPTFDGGLIWRRGSANEKNQPTLPISTTSVIRIAKTFIRPSVLIVCSVLVTTRRYVGRIAVARGNILPGDRSSCGEGDETLLISNGKGCCSGNIFPLYVASSCRDGWLVAGIS